MRALRIVLILDAAALLLLGVAFLWVPGRVAAAFHFADLPPSFDTLIRLWGCALASLGVGYALASRDPARNVAWIQAGIFRGLMEVFVSVLSIVRGDVTFQQIGLSTIAGGLFALAYIVLYPREALPLAANPADSPDDETPARAV